MTQAPETSDKLSLAYERIIRLVEEKDVTPETDQILQKLGEELHTRPESGEALCAALGFLLRCYNRLPKFLQRAAHTLQRLRDLEPRRRLHVLVDAILAEPRQPTHKSLT